MIVMPTLSTFHHERIETSFSDIYHQLMREIAFVQKLIRYFLFAAFGLGSVALNAQLEWAQVSIVCPCSLESEDGETATVQFGLENFEDHPTENLYATIAVTGTFDDEEFSDEVSMFLGTAPLNFGLSGFEEVATNTYEIEFGQLPAGTVYLELLIHEGRRPTSASLLDSIWFEEETEMPFTSLSKRDMDFLTDTDGDGVDDVNERLMNTDPNDPEDFPSNPEIDVLVVYESDISDELPGDDPTVQISHIFAVTEFLFERSGTPLDLRLVGTLDETEVPEIEDAGLFSLLPEELRDELQDQYGADLVVVFHPDPFLLCGIAEDIGGWRGRGFIHPLNRAILTHVWLDFSTCPINVTAHEIGHLMGLGHSYVQGSVGAYYWSRGHGEHNEFGTIMSYADSAYNGIDIDKFSNPDEDCNGKPCGISHELSNHQRSSDSVLSMNITKYQMAAMGSPPSDLDVDGDGYAADTDQFPLDSAEWVDTDGDGHGDNSDQFPNLASEWVDTDGDGIGDNSDPDIDDDGVLNQHDADVFDPEVSAIQIVNIVSGQPNDGLGEEVVLTGDWDSDGLDDLAISAPEKRDEDGEAVGAVYLLSMADLAANHSDGEQQGSRRELSQLLADEKAWAIHGTVDSGEIGMHMAYLSVPEEAETSGNLVISTERSVYLIELDETKLRSFDGLDGDEDRQLSLEFCEDSQACLFAGENNDFVVKGIVETHDRNNDGISDFAVLGTRQEADDVSLYLFTSSSVLFHEPETEEVTSTFDEIVSDSRDAFRIYTDTARNDVYLANLGNLTGVEGHELGIALDGVQGQSEVVYILNTAQVFVTDLNDGSDDGQVHIDQFPSGDGGSYKITMSDSNSFGHVLDSVADIDEDDRPEVLIWSLFGPHVLLTNEGLKNTDERDGSTDGITLLNESSHEYDGAWFFNDIPAISESSQAVLSPTADDQNNYFLIQYRDGVLLAELDDLDSLDDPVERRRDSQISYSSLFLDQPGNSRLRVPQGLRFGTTYGGMYSLGDLDEDGALDFMFTAHTPQLDRQLASTVHLMFSASFPTIDRSDGAEDGVLHLHNNLDDTDGDGIVNLHDLDDDGDGALDSYDVFPLNSEGIYDADGDGTANAIDAFPNNPFEDSDLDGDGIGDLSDRDIDGDGIENSSDEFPGDTDNDGLNNYEDLDDDNDGLEDALDAFPLDPDEQYDTDGDGYGDNVDLFADDENEWEDFDLDGIGDNGDLDDDNDGYEDEIDHFPFNPDEWLDSDGDGIGDNADPFPNNPFEWEDTDNDGLGDNLGTSAIAMHRIESDWRDFSFSLSFQEPSAHYLWDFDSTGGRKLLIHGGNPSDSRGSIYLLSSTDLNQLDLLDQQTNQSIQVGEIAKGTYSWEFRGPRSTELRYDSFGAVTDLEADSIGDLVIGSPYEESGRGAIFIVHGNQLGYADSIDGLVDGKINHTQCSFMGTCVAIFNSSDSLFGNSVTSLNGFFGEDTSVVAVANFFTTERPEEGEEGMPVIHLLSNAAILEQVEELQDSDLDLNLLQEREGTYQIYSAAEDDDSSTLAGVIVHQVADYDNDNAEDLIIASSFPTLTYFLSSSDIRAADSDDGSEDGLIDVANILKRPNSYEVEGFTPVLTSSRTTAWGSSPNAPQFVPMFGGNDVEHFLLDISELEIHVDPEEEGIITRIDISDTNAWELRGLGDLEVCNGGMDQPNTRVVGQSDSFDVRSFYWFTLSQLRAFAEDAAISNNRVDIPAAFESGTSGFWSIGFGSLNDQLDSLHVSCIGDWDNDGEEDLAVSILQSRGGFFAGEEKATVFLLMTGDLTALDRLDGEEDNEVDLSLLWRTATDE